jgi:hypothetical protein
MYPAHAGHGFVALARRDFDRAVTAFDVAVGASHSYVRRWSAAAKRCWR